jgi:hypothetical protein
LTTHGWLPHEVLIIYWPITKVVRKWEPLSDAWWWYIDKWGPTERL